MDLLFQKDGTLKKWLLHEGKPANHETFEDWANYDGDPIETRIISVT